MSEGWKIEETDGGYLAVRWSGSPKFCLFGKTMDEAVKAAEEAMKFYASRLASIEKDGTK